MKPEQKKQKRIAIYVSEDDYNKLQSKLRLVGKNVSEWVRTIIKSFLRENGE